MPQPESGLRVHFPAAFGCHQLCCAAVRRARLWLSRRHCWTKIHVLSHNRDHGHLDRQPERLGAGGRGSAPGRRPDSASTLASGPFAQSRHRPASRSAIAGAGRGRSQYAEDAGPRRTAGGNAERARRNTCHSRMRAWTCFMHPHGVFGNRNLPDRISIWLIGPANVPGTRQSAWVRSALSAPTSRSSCVASQPARRSERSTNSCAEERGRVRRDHSRPRSDY